MDDAFAGTEGSGRDLSRRHRRGPFPPRGAASAVVPQRAFLRALARTKAVMDAAKARYDGGGIGLAELRDTAARASRVRARARHVRDVRARGPARDEVALAQLDRLEAALARGGTVTALDVGHEGNDTFDEVGISTLRAGRVATVTLVVDSALHRHPDPARRVLRHEGQWYRPSLHGPSEVLPKGEVLRRVADAMAGADIVAFHSVGADTHKLGMGPGPDRLFDTETVGWAWTRRCPSLAGLCALHGIPTEGSHNSGNDAFMTVSLALALARGPTRERLAARVAARERRDALRGALVCRPSRRPWPAGALDEWRAACAECAGLDENCMTSRAEDEGLARLWDPGRWGAGALAPHDEAL